MNSSAFSIKSFFYPGYSENIIKRRFFDFILLVGFLCCLVPGPMPGLTTIAAALIFLCAAVSINDENFYLYSALFIFMRYRLLIGDSPAFRLYSYLVVLKFLWDFHKIKFRAIYFPALFVFLVHSVFAVPKIESLRIGLNVIVDTVLIYIILLQVLSDSRLFRKFMFVFLCGTVSSGVYGWTDTSVSVDINIRGAGAHTVNRNFGSLGDSNLAGMFYSLSIIVALIIKDIPKLLRWFFLGVFVIILLQTASLSGLLVLAALSAFLIVLKYRGKSVFILFLAIIGIVVGLTMLLSIPAFRQIDAIAGLIIRINEKLSYIPRGRWDLLTTDRSALWGNVIAIFTGKALWGKLIGGSVITVFAMDESLVKMACHNSYLQSIMNFGIIGTLFIYLPFFATFFFRLRLHFSKKSGYENEDVKMIQLVCMFAFAVFGGTVDFFIDWPYMMLYFI